MIETFFVHDLLQLIIKVVSAFGEHVGPLVTQNTEIFLLIAVESFLKFRPSTHAANGHVVDRLTDDWQSARIVYWSNGHQNAS